MKEEGWIIAVGCGELQVRCREGGVGGGGGEVAVIPDPEYGARIYKAATSRAYNGIVQRD